MNLCLAAGELAWLPCLSLTYPTLGSERGIELADRQTRLAERLAKSGLAETSLAKSRVRELGVRLQSNLLPDRGGQLGESGILQRVLVVLLVLQCRCNKRILLQRRGRERVVDLRSEWI